LGLLLLPSILGGAGFANLRLAVVSPFVDRRHGTERALAELLERLAGNYKCEVHLYAQRVENLAITGGRAAADASCGAIFWHRVPALPGPPVVQFIAWAFLNRAVRWWDSSFRSLMFDLILSPGINCFDADVILVHAVFQRARELWREEVQVPSARPGVLRRMHRGLYYRLLTFLEGRIYTRPQTSLATVSQRTAGQLVQYFQREDVRVIPNGIDTRQFSPSHRLARRAESRSRWNFRDDEFVLLLIGNAWHAKGLASVLCTMGALPDLPLRLMIVGSDEQEPFCKIAERLGILDRCHWTGPEEDVLEFYAAADLYAGPSLEDSFGLPIAEAMACGLPVITSNRAGVAEWIRNGVDGFILEEPRNAKELADVIQRLYADAELRTKIGEEAASAAREWTWDRNAAAVWKLLHDSAVRLERVHV
jgi:glycosyltransferase involved in cell wall biosynthesis